MGYLKCKSCKGIYELQEGEAPADFKSCNCGGELEYFDSLENGTTLEATDSEEYIRAKRAILRIGLFILAFYIIYMVFIHIFSGIILFMADFGPAWGSILIPLFIIGSIVIIIVLIWYGWRK